MAITTIDGLVSALGTSQDQQLFFPSATNVAGGWINLNQAVTSSFGIMATPTAFGSGGTTYNQSGISTGFPRYSNPGGGNTGYIGRVDLAMATVGTIHVYDLLWACSGFSGTTAPGAQSVVGFSGLPTRNSTGAGAEIWIGCSSATGASASNMTVQYTNSSGTGSRNTVSTAHITSMPANRMYQVSLQSGDSGVQSVQSITLSATTGTAGNLWCLVMKRLASVSCSVANVATTSDFAGLGLPALASDGTILFVHQGSTTSSGVIMGQLSIVQG